MLLNGKEIEAVIFDLDGTLIDSTHLWSDIDATFFSAHHMEIPRDYSKKIAHIGLKEAAIFTKNEYGFEESVEEILAIWNKMALDMYANIVPLKSYAKEFMEYLKANGVKMALATANSSSLYEPCLKRLQIASFFDSIADVDTVHAGKDNVSLYDHVCESLGSHKENTMVLEDISVGLKTAYENGYYAVAVYDKNSVKDEENKKKYSYAFIHSFKELMK